MKANHEFQQQLLEKAMKDPDSRKRFIEDPKTVIEEETGLKIPDGINVLVMEEDENTIYLVLPFVPAQTDDTELAETELDSIAGGIRTAGCTVIAAGCTGGCSVLPDQC